MIKLGKMTSDEIGLPDPRVTLLEMMEPGEDYVATMCGHGLTLEALAKINKWTAEALEKVLARNEPLVARNVFDTLENAMNHPFQAIVMEKNPRMERHINGRFVVTFEPKMKTETKL